MLLNRARAVELMERAGVDVLVATSKENQEYVSGYRSNEQWAMPSAEAAAILPRDPGGEIVLVVGVPELDVVADADHDADRVEPFGRFFLHVAADAELTPTERRLVALRARRWHAGLAPAVGDVLRDLGLARGTVALDATGLQPETRVALAGALAEAAVTDGTALLRRIRTVKTPDEVARIEHATRAAEDALLDALAAATDGVDEAALAERYRQRVREAGADPTHVGIHVGRRGALMGVAADARARVRPGAPIKADVGAGFRSYLSDVGRTAVAGAPDARLAELAGALHRGQQRGLALLRPGAVPAQVFADVMETVRAAGLAHYERPHVGHGIGIELYDPPALSPAGTEPLVAGMVVNLETPYYEIGWGGVQIEDTVLVTDTGSRRLTRSDGGLIVV